MQTCDDCGLTFVPGERHERLRDAARLMCAIYPLIWDRTDGAAVVMPDCVPTLEAAFAALSNAIKTEDELESE